MAAVIVVSLACACVASATPFYVCRNDPRKTDRICVDRFNAARLVGLRLAAAERLAAQHGYVLRRAAPLRKGEYLRMDYESDRVEVETSAPNDESTIIRIIGRG